MANLTLSRRRRYRIGSFKMSVVRATGHGAGSTNSIQSERLRYNRIYGVIMGNHSQNMGAESSCRIKPNAVGVLAGAVARNGDVGCATSAVADLDLLIIGR